MPLRVEWQSEPGARPLAPMVALSFAVHVLMAALAFAAPYVLPRRVPAAPIIVVDLVSLPEGGAGPLEAPRATPPPPTRKKEQAPPPAPQPKPRPEPKSKKPEAVKLPEPGKSQPPEAEAKPEPEPEVPPPVATGVTPPGASPEPGPAPGVGGAGPPGLGQQHGGGIGALDAETFEFAWYRAALTQRLRSSWAKPSMPNLGAPIRTVVYFRVMRNGQITDVQLESSSGLDVLDRSALRAVYDANPLPPLPYAYKGGFLGVHFFFELVPE